MTKTEQNQAKLLFVPFRTLFVPDEGQSPALNTAVVDKLAEWKDAGWSIYCWLVETRHLDNNTPFAGLVEVIKRSHGQVQARRAGLIEGLQVCFHTRKMRCLCRPPQPGLIHNGIYNHSRRWGGEGLISRKNVMVVGNWDLAARAGVESIFLLTEFLKADPKQYFKGAA